jgi:FkbM family methyltransferase
MLRRLLERISRNRVVRRRLPPRHGGHRLFVSPDASLRLWRTDLGPIDPLLLGLASELVAAGSVVWDVGANVGLFAFASAYAAGPNGRVIAVEADPWLAGLLRRSAADAPRTYAPVEVVEAAASDADREATFCIATRGRATSHLKEVSGSTQSGGVRQEIKVAARRLDSLLGRFPPPGLLKIDVEGAEGACLRGATRLLREPRPVVLCEVSAENVDQVGALLHGFGYRLLDASLPGPDREPLDRPTWNTLAVPG